MARRRNTKLNWFDKLFLFFTVGFTHGSGYGDCWPLLRRRCCYQTFVEVTAEDLKTDEIPQKLFL